MPITLKIISYQRLTPGQQESFQTDLDKFCIGRNADNDWTLPDPQRFMSGTHCWLENRQGTWYVTDTSTNGVFINGSDQRLNKNESVALAPADRIRLGDYDLEVDLQESEQAGNNLAGTTADGPFDSLLDQGEDILGPPEILQDKPKADIKEANTPLSQMDSSLLGGSVSIDELYALDDDEEDQVEPPSLASHGDQVPPLQQHFTTPEVAQVPASTLPDKYAADFDEIPENWDEETGLLQKPAAAVPERVEQADAEPPAAIPASETARPAATPRAEPSRQAIQSIAADSAIAAFAAGAGLDLNQLQIPDEQAFFRDLGELISTMTEGLMQAHASKGQIRSEFHLEQTMIGATENNPIKFSASAQEALLRLLNRTDSAYLSGSFAAAQAIDDINAHQMAVMAGTEAALKSVLRRFRPATLESKFGSDSLISKALPFLKKARYWEFYKVLYEEVSEAADDDFQKFFGNEFSNAYKKQLDQLIISRKESSK